MLIKDLKIKKGDIMNNKKNFSLVIVVSLLLVLLTGMQAQQDQRPPRPPDSEQIKQIVNKLSAELSLTDDQKEKVLKLFDAHFKKMGDLMKNNGPGGPEGGRESGGGRREGMKNDSGLMMSVHMKMDKLRASFVKEVKALLTIDQQKKFDEFMKNNRPQRDRGV